MLTVLLIFSTITLIVMLKRVLRIRNGKATIFDYRFVLMDFQTNEQDIYLDVIRADPNAMSCLTNYGSLRKVFQEVKLSFAFKSLVVQNSMLLITFLTLHFVTISDHQNWYCLGLLVAYMTEKVTICALHGMLDHV